MTCDGVMSVSNTDMWRILDMTFIRGVSAREIHMFDVYRVFVVFIYVVGLVVRLRCKVLILLKVILALRRLF